jgi:hypothetical protein
MLHDPSHRPVLPLKDISTVRYGPQKLREWAKIAVEVAEEFAR